MKRFPLVFTAVSIAVLASTTVASAQRQCDDIRYRIWQNDGQSRYAHGDTIELSIGVESHLYIEHASRSDLPYRTGAQLGPAADFGIRAFPRDETLRILDIRRQGGDDRQNGRLIFTPRAGGTTAVGYRIESVASQGIFERLHRDCRQGLVRIRVLGPGGSTGTPPPPRVDRRNAARRLAEAVEEGLAPWLERTGEDVSIPAIVRDGRRGLGRLAGEVLRSRGYRATSWEETISAHGMRPGTPPLEVATRAMEDIYERLFKGVSPSAQQHDRYRRALVLCVTDQPSSDQACDNLGLSLVEHENFTRAHPGLLTQLEGRPALK